MSANQGGKCDGFLPPPPPLPKGVKIEEPDLGQESTFTANLKGQNIPVKYSKYRATVVPKKGTIIFLCGGPGVPCTGARPPGIPPEYDVVTLDYLGIGRNARYSKPEYMAIESQGNVVAQIAKRLKEPNLLIFARSFGTTVATVAGSLINTVASDTRKTVLKGVVLEGIVVGPDSGQSFSEGYASAAKHAWSYLSPKQRKNFKVKYADAVKGLSPEEKINIDKLIMMSMPSGTKATVEFLKNINSQYLRHAAQSDVFAFFTNFHNRPGVRDMFQAAGCQLHLKSERGIKIFDGTVDLIASGADKVCECRTVANNFNPNIHQIKAPIVYINGGQDPVTPLAGAKKHMEGQSHPSKVFISSPNGGHFDSFGLLKNCMPIFFEELNKGSFENLVSSAISISNGRCGSQTNPVSREQNAVQ